MSTRPDRQHRSRRFRAPSDRTRAALALGVVASLAAVGTAASWTDSATVAGARFSTGRLDLKVDGVDADVDLTRLDLALMVPGDSTAAVLTVKNAGTVPLTYTATSAATNPDGRDLAGGLGVRVTGATAVTGTGHARTCAGAALAGTGSSLRGSLVSSARPLAPGASERLCVEVALPSSAPATLADSATRATLTFRAVAERP